MAPIVGPAGEFAVVAVLVVFMLLERKRLREPVPAIDWPLAPGDNNSSHR